MSDTPKMTHMFDSVSAHQVNVTVDGMAHWIDETRTGNARCRTCMHFQPAKTRTAKGELRPGQCLEWKRRIDPKAAGRSWPKIPYATRACKYHEPAAVPPPAFIKRTIDGRDRG